MRLPPSADADDARVRAALEAFHAFLDRHPVADDELIANPALLENPAWLQFHRMTAAFLTRYPSLPAVLRANRHFYRWREVQRALRPTEQREELAAMDAFIERHPEQFPELARDPWLVEDPAFLQAHPVLQQVRQQSRALGSPASPTSGWRYAWD